MAMAALARVHLLDHPDQVVQFDPMALLQRELEKVVVPVEIDLVDLARVAQVERTDRGREPGKQTCRFLRE